jgi:RecJ-like exonuclease
MGKTYEVHVSSVSDFTATVEAESPIDAAQDAQDQGIGDWDFEQTEHIAVAVSEVNPETLERTIVWEREKESGYCSQCTHCNSL